MTATRRTFVATLCLAALCRAAAQPAPYAPRVGQAGKDVVWVPTSQALVDRMLDMAGLTPQDRLVDLGSGDGRLVITAARRGATARGIEYNPDMVALARRAAEAEGMAGRARFEQADIFQSDFSDATVVTLFLLPELNLRLRPILLDMAPGTRVLSNSFDMGDWQPDARITVEEGCAGYCNALKWVVPARVAGRWRLGDAKLQLAQTFQMLEGTLHRAGDQPLPIIEARLDGAQIRFRAGTDRYQGEVDGDTMRGTVNGRTPWQAVRR
ncbi:SAM-dependent methyltransferase [Pseudorhodoferax sp.]|uniref:class I SAM-dependent methyltransferase n=1 Tax=Pseudorhodoferax sp. TaxID=1993553 RepID=UPI0039E71F17